ncbi:hypothetical protein [Archangium primigenium]|uniref:hypothetical protein n=1 Tax=[Archangium] primigenium TaxID=2792470 RepID=UPI00195B9DB4|nr:hypothetical protein [Archangium primigenium]MBM7114037.1 hypothetical protein [Archangium primigenium]
MKGRTRVCKKHIRQAGWSIANEGQREKVFHLELHGPRGERMKVEAASEPLAYRHAERQVAGSEPGTALWAR